MDPFSILCFYCKLYSCIIISRSYFLSGHHQNSFAKHWTLASKENAFRFLQTSGHNTLVNWPIHNLVSCMFLSRTHYTIYYLVDLFTPNCQWLSSKESTCNAGTTGDMGSILGSGRYSGGGHRNPLQYSCLENPMDRGAWQATVHGGHKESYTTDQQHCHSYLNKAYLTQVFSPKSTPYPKCSCIQEH